MEFESDAFARSLSHFLKLLNSFADADKFVGIQARALSLSDSKMAFSVCCLQLLGFVFFVRLFTGRTREYLHQGLIQY